VPLGVCTVTATLPTLPVGVTSWIEVGVQVMFAPVRFVFPQCTVTEPDGKNPIPLIVTESVPCGEPEAGVRLFMNGFRLVSSWVRLEGSIGMAGPLLIPARTVAGRTEVVSRTKRACIV